MGKKLRVIIFFCWHLLSTLSSTSSYSAANSVFGKTVKQCNGYFVKYILQSHHITQETNCLPLIENKWYSTSNNSFLGVNSSLHIHEIKHIFTWTYQIANDRTAFSYIFQGEKKIPTIKCPGHNVMQPHKLKRNLKTTFCMHIWLLHTSFNFPWWFIVPHLWEVGLLWVFFHIYKASQLLDDSWWSIYGNPSNTR